MGTGCFTVSMVSFRVILNIAVTLLISLRHVSAARHKHSLRIVTLQEEPYLMIEYDEHRRQHYTGYIKDLLDAVMAEMGMGYELYVAPDNKYGNLQPGGVWNGMIHELLERKADIAAGPMYLTFPRAGVVQFTRPFMNISTTFLLMKSTLEKHPYIKTIQDLMDQSDIAFGTREVGTIVRAFKQTNDTLYRRMWHKMDSSPHVLTQTNKEGINRVRESRGRYAYILPSVIAEYMIGQEPCDLVTFGRFLNDRHFALAVPKKSVFLNRLNFALRRLEATGLLIKLYNKWWFQNRECYNKSYSSQLTSAKTYGSYSLCVYLTTVFVLVNRITM